MKIGTRRWMAVLGVLIASWSCGIAQAVAHRYLVTVNDELDAVTVRAELFEPVRWLSARQGVSSRLSALSTCDGRPVRTRRNRIDPGSAGCVQYRYPLVDPDDRGATGIADDVIVSAPDEWLWTPPIGGGDSVRVEFAAPPEMNVSAPWRSVGGRVFELLPSPGSSRASVVLGRFEHRIIRLPAADMRVALIDGPDRKLDYDVTLSWLRASAMDVAGVYGRFPNPAPQVIVQPSPVPGWGGGRSPVPFGYVIRDGGEAVRFFVQSGRPLADYLQDWTATHEFSHLLLPYVRSEDKWVSEGFASYYQNVLLARRGVYGEREAWERLHRSFVRAEAIDDPPSLADISHRPFWEVRMLIYWGGAAIALMADVELRRLSDGAESLDTALERLQACCLPSGRTWRGDDLFRKLDEVSGHSVFRDLFRRYASAPGMPSLSDVYERLGLVVEGSSVKTLVNDAPDARMRRMIMTGNG